MIVAHHQRIGLYIRRKFVAHAKIDKKSQMRYIIWLNLKDGESMSAQTTMLHVRVDEATKDEATETLNAMGLSVSDAVRLFLRRVVIEQAFPLELKVPNAETLAAMEESRAMMAARRARFANADALFDGLEKSR